MAESFKRPGVQCDVATFDGKPNGWEDFCACAFGEPRITYSYQGMVLDSVNTQYITVAGNRVALDGTAEHKVQLLLQAGYKVDTQVDATDLKHGADYDKCMAKQCLLPSGCWNPSRNAWDPFNAAPGMLAAPWTDFGASARGIPKRNAGLWFTIGQLISVDAAEYDPLKLWVTFWTNPAKFGLLQAKAMLTPLGPIISVWATNPITLLASAIIEGKEKGVDLNEAIIRPVVKGSIKAAGMALKYLGKCGIGINIPCGAGIVLQQAAQDQIDTGEINTVLDPFANGLIRFLAKHGEQLVTKIIDAVSGAQDPTVIQWFAIALKTLSDVMEPGDPKVAIAAASKVLDVAGVIAEGVSKGEPAEKVVDDVVYHLFGFSFIQWKRETETNVANARAQLEAGFQTNGFSLEGAIAVVQGLAKVVDALVGSIQKLNDSIGGGLEDVVSAVNSTKELLGGGNGAGINDAFSEMQQVASADPNLIATAKNAASVIRGRTAAIKVAATKSSATATPSKTPALQPTKTQPTVTTAPPPAVKAAPAKGTTLALVTAGAGAGVFVGGPVGAAVGAAAGLVVGLINSRRAVAAQNAMAGVDESEFNVEVGPKQMLGYAPRLIIHAQVPQMKPPATRWAPK